MNHGKRPELAAVEQLDSHPEAMVALRETMPSEETLKNISLVSSHEIDSINRAMNDDFRRIAAELRDSPECDLRARLRWYDGFQRMTFGRALTGLMAGGTVPQRPVETDFSPRRPDGNMDRSYFPRPFTKPNYPGLWAAIRYSVRMLSNAPMQLDSVLISVFCHRVLIRPGETYSGFTHRDLAPEAGRIGTVIWYPRVDAGNIAGAEIFSYEVGQEVTLEELAGRPADYIFDPALYQGKVMFLAYPHNYPHGVRPGRNQRLSDVACTSSLKDFLEPKESFFVKDLFILSVSERSPVED